MVSNICKRFAVIGNPIEHSLSPFIHESFAKQVGVQVQYDRILTFSDNFSTTLYEFFKQGGTGVNITLPFKETAYLLVENCTARARDAGAVNTIYLDKQGHLYGDNTDGIGLRRDLEKNLRVNLNDKKILLIGAGGAAKGIAGALLCGNPYSLTIANRTVTKAENLVTQLQSFLAPCHSDILGGGLELAIQQDYDIVINASSQGFMGNSPTEFKVKVGGLAYDLSYGIHSRAFLDFAASKGARAVDGLGMLIEQAAEAFFCWHGVFPETCFLLSSMRTATSN